jgi:glycosyltransferase involved in cell wall biosynthesis
MNPDVSPQLSVMIATRNRAGSLERTLEHLRFQEMPQDHWELIVVDNGSIDRTALVLSEAAVNLPLVALGEPKPGKNRALNRALEVARGELLVFTDDDVIPQPNWLRELYAASRRWPESSILGGKILPIFPFETPSWLCTHPWAEGWAFSQFAPPLPEGLLPANLTPYGPNFAVRAQVMRGIRYCEEIGPQGQNYAMGSETELIKRLMAMGERCVYVPTAVVNHVIDKVQVNLRWLQGRAFRAGRGKVRCSPSDSAARLFGVPRHLWRSLLSSGVRYSLSLFSDERRRFEAGIRFNTLRGKIYEYRLLARENVGSK